MVMRRDTPRIPKLSLDLLLYTNMGAEALAKYLKTTKVATRRWKLGIDNKPNSGIGIGWGTLDQPQDEHHDGSSGETGDEEEETRRRRQGTGRRRGAGGSGSAGDV
jgi:hypothetical protein